MTRTFAVASCTNSDVILEENLLRSPDVRSGRLPCELLRGARSAALAYNGVLESNAADVVVCVHQDIYLPKGSAEALETVVETVERRDPDWGVLGVYGMTPARTQAGFVYDGCNRRVLGHVPAEPVRAAMLDEIVLIVNRRSGVRFDPGLPGFHMYGTDIVLAAAALGKTAYVVNLPVLHNSESIRTLDASFERSWRHLSKRWRAALPVPNLMLGEVNGSAWPLWRWRLRNRVKLMQKKRILYERIPDVTAVAREIGFE